MKAAITIIVLLALVAFAAFCVKAGMDRSKKRELTLWAFDGKDASGNERKADNLGKMGVGGVSGLEENKEEDNE